MTERAEVGHQATRLTGGLMVAALAGVLALAPLATLGRVSAALLVVALALALPVVGPYLAVLSVPVQELAHLPGGLSYTQAAVLLAVGAWLLSVLAHPARQLRLDWTFWLWAALLWALLLSTSLTPYSQSLALRETARWCVAFAVWLVAVTTLRRRWQVLGLLACLLVAPGVEALIGLSQFVRGDGPPSFRIAANLPFVRAYGTLGTPNAFAGYMNMAWPLALAVAVGATLHLAEQRAQGQWRAWSPAQWWGRVVVVGMCWAVALSTVAGLVLSYSRGSWLGALGGLAGLALALGRRSARLVMLGGVLSAAVLAAGIAGLLPASLTNRVASITASLTFIDPSTVVVTPQNFAVVERMAQLWAGARMFVEHPLTGVGPGNYSLAYADVTAPPWYVSRGHAHNYYVHMAAEAGLVGLAAYLTWIVGMSLYALRSVRATNRTFWRSVGVGCCGTIAAVAGHNLFENLHVLNLGIQLAAILALGATVSNVLENED